MRPRYHLRTTPADLKRLAKALERNRERRERQRRDLSEALQRHVADGAWVDSPPASFKAPPVEAPSLTCPRCKRTTWHPEDIRQGYCGACHDWTSPSEHERQDPTP